MKWGTQLNAQSLQESHFTDEETKALGSWWWLTWGRTAGGGGRVPLAVTPSPWPLPRCTLPRSEAGHREEGRTGPVQSQKQWVEGWWGSEWNPWSSDEDAGGLAKWSCCGVDTGEADPGEVHMVGSAVSFTTVTRSRLHHGGLNISRTQPAPLGNVNSLFENCL